MGSNIYLGMAPHADEVRDAVHVAVIPCKAGAPLKPGDKVRVVEGEAFPVSAEQPWVGVVDPFLRGGVERGGLFWCLLQPFTVRDLRHDWHHGSFPRTHPVKVSASERWLRNFAETHRIGFEEMVEGVVAGEYVCFGDDYGPRQARTPEFWEHLSRYTGKTFTAADAEAADFGCSC